MKECHFDVALFFLQEGVQKDVQEDMQEDVLEEWPVADKPLPLN